MRAYQIQTHGVAEGLVRVDLPRPKPASDQVLIRVQATSLNFRDLVVLEGRYAAHPRLPLIPLSDGAGEIVEIGAAVTRWRVGDRVAGCFFPDWQRGDLTREWQKRDLGGGLDGMMAEFVAAPESGVVQIPDHVSFAEAATLPCAALTAWHALISKGQLAAGETVLLLGTGGVSIFALQLAKLRGARVLITSSSDDKLARARALGADETINYKATPQWDRRVFELTERRGVDHVVEVGGAGTLAQSLRAARHSGTVSLIGVVAGRGAQIDPMPILWNSLTVRGIYVGSVEMFVAMNEALSAANLHPVIDRVFPFEQLADAYRYLESGQHFGKVVVSL